MLKKLIKYDLKYEFRIFILLHVILIISCILGRVLFIDRIRFDSDPETLILTLTLLVSAFTILFSGICFGTLLLYSVRFYKNLFTDEGYITWTLPASPLQQLWAKIISAGIWYTIDIFLYMFCMKFLISGKNVQAFYQQFAPEFTEAFGMSVSSFFWVILLFSLANVFASVMMIYTSIAIGQLLPAHRVLVSVIVYFILNLFTQLITMAISFSNSPYLDYNARTAAEPLAQSLIKALSLTTLFTFIAAVIGYFITLKILKKKLNLI